MKLNYIIGISKDLHGGRGELQTVKKKSPVGEGWFLSGTMCHRQKFMITGNYFR